MEAGRKENRVEVVGDYQNTIQYRWNFVLKIPIRKIIQHKQTNKQEERKATKTLYGIITECDTHAYFDVDFKSLH